MATIKSVKNALSVAVRLLDSAATEIRDAEIEPTHENIAHIGHALSEIFQLQHILHELEPSTKSSYLDEVPSSPRADVLLIQYLGEAIEIEQSGNTQGAIDKLSEFLIYESTPHHKEIVRGEITRLSGG